MPRSELREPPAPGAARPTSDFDLSNLNRLVYGRGFTLWHYRSRNTRLDKMTAPGYFADASEILKEGDIVLLVGADGARVVLVAAVDFQVVSLSPLT